MSNRKPVLAAEDKYRAARDRVASGLWLVDPLAGTVSNADGRTLGYVDGSGRIALALWDGVRKRAVAAHRVIWETAHGPIPPMVAEYQINHINGDPTDNRLANLELVTAAENIQHAHRTGLAQVARGEQAPWSRLTEQQVADIRRRYAAGERQHEIASDFGLTRGHIGAVVTGRAWAASLTEPAPSRAARWAALYPMPEHGTISRYKGHQGGRWEPCRCAACREANTLNARRVRERARQRHGIPPTVGQ